MLIINHKDFEKRAEIIWEKGTNRAEYFRGEVNKYGWVDIGSLFLPSEIIAAFLWAQIENIDNIQNKRKFHWQTYMDELRSWAKLMKILVPSIPDYATNNAHMFYLVCNSLEQRENLLHYLDKNEIFAVSHYQSLHNSPFYKYKFAANELPQSNRYSDCLIRLPLYYELCEIDTIIRTLYDYENETTY